MSMPTGAPRFVVGGYAQEIQVYSQIFVLSSGEKGQLQVVAENKGK